MKTSSITYLIAAIVLFHSSNIRAASVRAWGDNGDGQTNVPVSLTNAVAIDAGIGFGLALRQDGTVVGWGDPFYASTPKGLNNVVAIAAGSSRSFALRSDGTVVGWGYLAYVPLLTNVVAIAAGPIFAVALKADDTLFVWGTQGPPLVPPPDLTNAVAISVGNDFVLALRADHSVIVFGLTSLMQDTFPNDLTNVVGISAGSKHALALQADGRVRAWGDNSYGQLGVPADLTNVVAVSAGDTHSLALISDGRIRSWGTGPAFPTDLPFAVGICARGTYGAFDLALVNAGQASPPTLLGTLYPTNQNALVHSSAFISVGAAGTPPLYYQWYFGVTPLIGQTNSILRLSDLNPAQSGQYTVVVTNMAGSVTSQPATLTVVPGLDVKMVPGIYLQGQVGYSYRIEYMNVIGPVNSWNPLATLTLTNNQQVYFDLSVLGQPSRIYRLVQLP